MTTRLDLLRQGFAAAGLITLAPAEFLLPADAIPADIPVVDAPRVGPPRPPAGHWLFVLEYRSGATRSETIGTGFCPDDCEHCTVRSFSVVTDRAESWIGERWFDDVRPLRVSPYRYEPSRYQVQIRHRDGHFEVVSQPDFVRGTIYQPAIAL